jgi:uncharacterized protein (UPF0276 family)
MRVHPCVSAPITSMPAIHLSADLSDALLYLLRADEKLVDAVEVGPWFTPQQIRAYRQSLPDMPFYFHAADLIENIGSPSAGIGQIADYLTCTGSPWVSVHISVWQPGEVIKMKTGLRVPLPDMEQSRQRFVEKVMRLASSIQVPVLIENIEPLPFEGFNYWARPDFICRVFEQTGCGFLLDTGHARISAENLGMAVYDYLQPLPLERVVQVHVSGPRRVDGRLVDAHQPLQKEDYDLLEFILAKTHPQVVTLEYIQEADALREQLGRLRSISVKQSDAMERNGH